MALIAWTYNTRTTANSYLTAAEAITLTDDMPVTTAITAFLALTTLKQEQWLIRGTKRVDAFRYSGYLTYSDSLLKFPRSGIVIDGRAIESDTIPIDIQQATLEIALLSIESDINATNDAINYKSAQVGDLAVEYKDSQQTNPINSSLTPYIMMYLTPYFGSTRLGKS